MTEPEYPQWRCPRCGKLYTGHREDGGFVPGFGSLCTSCWDEWVAMKRRHAQEEEEFLKARK